MPSLEIHQLGGLGSNALFQFLHRWNQWENDSWKSYFLDAI